MNVTGMSKVTAKPLLEECPTCGEQKLFWPTSFGLRSNSMEISKTLN